MPTTETQVMPSLTRYDAPGRPRAVVVVLHGGRPESRVRVDSRSASWRLMLGLSKELAHPAQQEGISTWCLRYRYRGWNGGDPVADARWALGEVRREHGGVPVVLVGHSMGGRVALHAADDPSVVGVVGLAPWIAEDTPLSPLAGKRLVAAHGRRDRITSYAATRDFVDQAQGVATSARFVDMGPLGHYLIRGRRRWFEVATTEALGLLAD